MLPLLQETQFSGSMHVVDASDFLPTRLSQFRLSDRVFLLQQITANTMWALFVINDLRTGQYVRIFLIYCISLVSFTL